MTGQEAREGKGLKLSVAVPYGDGVREVWSVSGNQGARRPDQATGAADVIAAGSHCTLVISPKGTAPT